MKHITLAISMLLFSLMPLNALDLIDKDEKVFVQIGFDLEGAVSNSHLQMLDTLGHPMSNPDRIQGTDQEQAWEISIGLEEQVNQKEFGSRKILTYYDAGKITRYDGTYTAYNKNTGIEASYEIYYKWMTFFRPSIGAGVGINVLHHYDDGWREVKEFSPTVHVSAGVTGEIVDGLGYYVNYKHRFANNSIRTVPIYRGGLYLVRVDLDGAEGDKFLLGLTYKF